MKELGFVLIGMVLVGLGYMVVNHPLNMVSDSSTTVIEFERVVNTNTGLPVVKAIEERGNGKSIEIYMGKNYGGYVYIYEKIRKAVRNTDKTVVVTCRYFCASAGAMTLYVGDYAKIYKEGAVLFHAVRYGNGYAYRIPNIKLLETDMDRSAFAITLMMLDRIRSQVTLQEWMDMMHGKDVVVSGTELCARNDTVIDNDEYCLIKGNKSNKLYDEELYEV